MLNFFNILNKGASMKMLQVENDTHKQIKEQAVKKGMSIKEYVQYLADKDNEK
jgi:hypothetical protein